MAEIRFAAGQLIAQGHPLGIVATTAFKADVRTEIMLILSVVTGMNVDIVFHHDDTGADIYTANNLITFQAKTTSSDSNTFVAIGGAGTGIMVQKGGSIGIQISVADSVTFSLYGITESVAPTISGSRNR